MRELALHILDVLRNAVEASATRVALTIVEDVPADRLTITVSDNGRGMDAQVLAQVTQPFFTSRKTRHVGLGLPLFAAAAERAGGQLAISSQPGVGTIVEATFALSHPDRQPLGDIAETLLAFLLSEQNPQLDYRHRIDREGAPGAGGKDFSFDTVEIRAALAGVPLTHPAVVQWLAEFLKEGEAELEHVA